MQKRTSRGHLKSIIAHLKKVGTLPELRTYWANEIVPMLGEMSQADRSIAMDALGRTFREFDDAHPIPDKLPRKIKWTPENIERLRRAEARWGTDDGIARELYIPIKTAKAARWKYLGVRRVAKAAVAAAASVQA